MILHAEIILVLNVIRYFTVSRFQSKAQKVEDEH